MLRNWELARVMDHVGPRSNLDLLQLLHLRHTLVVPLLTFYSRWKSGGVFVVLIRFFIFSCSDFFLDRPINFSAPFE